MVAVGNTIWKLCPCGCGKEQPWIKNRWADNPNQNYAHHHPGSDFPTPAKVRNPKTGRMTQPKNSDRTHTHAFGFQNHKHGTAVCDRPECEGYEKHGSHPGLNGS